jgi:hypothetical protein
MYIGVAFGDRYSGPNCRNHEMKQLRKYQDLAFHCTIPLSLDIRFFVLDPDRTQILGIPLLPTCSLRQPLHRKPVLVLSLLLVYLFRPLFPVPQTLCPLTLPPLFLCQTSSN